MRSLSCAVMLLAVPALGATAPAPDGWLTSKAKFALWTEGGVRPDAVHLDTVDGVVTVIGRVSTFSKKALAEKLLRAIPGVVALNNELQVVPEEEPLKVPPPDKQLKERVTKALMADPLLRESGIEVRSVEAGLVLLTGQAARFTDHLHAVAVVSRLPGVERVSTRVVSPGEFGPEERVLSAAFTPKLPVQTALADLRTTAAVKLKLLTTAYVPSTEIRVDTQGAVVTLFGRVPTGAAKAGAEVETAALPGVLKVENLLEVVTPAVVQAEVRDRDIEKDLTDQLYQLDEFLDVDFTVNKGVVRLTGTVPTGWDKLTAVRTARSAWGVRAVEENLTVRPMATHFPPRMF